MIKYCWLTLFDVVINVSVSEIMVYYGMSNNIKKFISGSTEDKSFICLTKDLFESYCNVATEIRVNKQLYIFHLFQTILTY